MAQSDRVATLALLSIPVALGVMGIKFLAWQVSGSVALYSDALESIVNVIAALLAWSAIRIARKPPDENHPFGHHKAEYFSAVMEGVMVVVAAGLIFHEALGALRAPAALEAPGLGMAINSVAAAINGAWAWMLIRTGREARSPALTADGRHILTDVVTSAGVLVGLGLALATGWLWLDPLLACVVGLNVLREGWRVIFSSVEGLMDRAVDPVCAELIRDTIRGSAEGAIEVHDIKTRAAGPVTFIEFHLVVDGKMSVGRAHAICDRIENALRAAVADARISIHVEPAHKRESHGIEIG